jgi:hypothetical protein
MAAWREVAGPATAAHAWPVCLEQDGRLVVAVKGSLWRQELSLLLPQLAEGLTALDQAVASIKLVVARTPPPLLPPEKPPPLELDPSEQAGAGLCLECVSDPGLRQSLLNLRLAQLLAEKLR